MWLVRYTHAWSFYMESFKLMFKGLSAQHRSRRVCTLGNVTIIINSQGSQSSHILSLKTHTTSSDRHETTHSEPNKIDLKCSCYRQKGNQRGDKYVNYLSCSNNFTLYGYQSIYLYFTLYAY